MEAQMEAMRKAQTGRRRFRIGASPWEGMGAGFTDQGFAEHFFALQHKNLYSVSHRTCKLKYVHFNMPPKPWSVTQRLFLAFSELQIASTPSS